MSFHEDYLKDIGDKDKELRQEFGKTNIDKAMLNKRLFAYDAFQQDDETGEYSGFVNEDSFVSLVVQNETQGVFNISLTPSTLFEKPVLNVQQKQSKEIYSQDESNFATWFYSKERVVLLTDFQLKLNKKLVFFTFESIYRLSELEDGSPTNIINDQDVFVVDSYEEELNSDGSFRNGILTVKKVNPFITRKTIQDGEGNTIIIGIEINFLKVPLQPKNVRRIRRTYSARPLIRNLSILDGQGLSVNWKFTPNNNNGDGKQWSKHLMPWKRSSNSVSFIPVWTQEFKYWQRVVKDEIIRFNAISNLLVSARYDLIEVKNNGEIKPLSKQGDGLNKAVPVNIYKSPYADAIGVGSINDDDFEELAIQTLDFLLPDGYDLFGLRKGDGTSSGGNIVPRKEGSDGWWFSQKEELLYFNDFGLLTYVDLITIGESGLVLNFNHPNLILKNDRNYDYDDGSVGEYDEYYDLTIDKTGNIETNFTKNIALLLQGLLVWNGTSWTELPPNSLTEDAIDFNVPTDKYDTNGLNKSIWIYPLSINEVWDISQSTDISNEIGKTSTKEIIDFPILQYEYNMDYLISNSWKQPFLANSLFTKKDPQGKKYVIEQEFDINIPLITQDNGNLYGGYTETIEYFSNSYDDSINKDGTLENPIDIPITVDLSIFGKEFEIDYPIQEYVAENLKGNPLSASYNRVYGTTQSPLSTFFNINKNKKVIDKKELKSKKIKIEDLSKLFKEIEDGKR